MLNCVLLLFIIGALVWLIFFRNPPAISIDREGYDADNSLLLELRKIVANPPHDCGISDYEFEQAANAGRVQIMASPGQESGKSGREGFSYYIPNLAYQTPSSLYTTLYDYTPTSLYFPGWRFRRTRQRVYSPSRWRLWRGVWYLINQ